MAQSSRSVIGVGGDRLVQLDDEAALVLVVSFGDESIIGFFEPVLVVMTTLT
jgi:hypothetical protein